MEDTILKVNQLSISFAQKSNQIFSKTKQKEILHQLSFSIKENEVIGLVGESGCGKTTLAKTLLGFYPNYTGTIEFCEELKKHRPQMIFQDPYSSLNPKKTIRFILSEPLKMNGHFSREEREEKITYMIQKVGLTKEYLDRYPKELSGGQRQRVCIAEALMLQPKLLIADEPVSALDVTIQDQVMQLLFSLHKEMGISILFISHDLRMVYQISDTVMVMKSGAIIEKGNVDDVYYHPQQEYTKNLIKNADLY